MSFHRLLTQFSKDTEFKQQKRDNPHWSIPFALLLVSPWNPYFIDSRCDIPQKDSGISASLQTCRFSSIPLLF